MTVAGLAALVQLLTVLIYCTDRFGSSATWTKPKSVACAQDRDSQEISILTFGHFSLKRRHGTFFVFACLITDYIFGYTFSQHNAVGESGQSVISLNSQQNQNKCFVAIL